MDTKSEMPPKARASLRNFGWFLAGNFVASQSLAYGMRHNGEMDLTVWFFAVTGVGIIAMWGFIAALIKQAPRDV